MTLDGWSEPSYLSHAILIVERFVGLLEETNFPSVTQFPWEPNAGPSAGRAHPKSSLVKDSLQR
jgi:hypothetical protein